MSFSNLQQYPLVSILINNYNYGHFLDDAIHSALNQSYPFLEIIVVDDGSTDDSQRIIESYGEKVIPILKKNGGQASAFNVGFEKSQGDIICFLDSDDIFLPDKVQKIVAAFERYEDTGWCFHPLKMVDVDLQEVNSQQYSVEKSGVYDVQASLQQGKLRNELPVEGIATSGTCFQRKLLKQILPMPEAIRITSDDYIKYAALGLDKGIFLLEEIALQRIHGSNAYTNRNDKTQLRAEIAILTSYWLRKNFPVLTEFTHKIFAYGLATYSPDSKNAFYFQKMMHEYQSSLTLSNWLKIKLRSYFYSLKYYLKSK